MKTVKTILLSALTLTSIGCAGLQLTGGGISVSSNGSVSGAVVLSSSDREIIARYYSSHRGKRTPPGLAKRGGRLPHGLAKRDTLPRGLQERGLPADLQRQLRPLPSGYVRVIVGNDIVLMNRDTRVVMDIYRDIVR
jgi:hypothetical protein